MKWLFSIVCLYIVLAGASSQDNQAIFKRLSTSEGLSNNWVRNIYMDDIGYMWFGTADGLSKYDGHQFITYRPGTSKGKQIGSINVSAVLKKSQHELWICTDLGVYTYNYSDDRLHLFSKLGSVAALCILKDRAGDIWFGTSSGLYRYTPSSGNLSHFVHNPLDSTSLSNIYVNSLLEDSDGNIWVGTKDGINLFLEKTGNFRRYRLSLSPGISTNDIMSLCEDHNRRIWAGDFGSGAWVFEMDKKKPVEFKKIIEGKVLQVYADSKNWLWIASSSGEGLTRIKLDHFIPGKKVVTEIFRKNNQDPHTLSDNSVFSIYEDKFRDIWIGTFGGGLSYYSPRAKKFNVVREMPDNKNSIQHDLINAFSADDTHLYIGTEGGLDILDKRTGHFTHFGNERDNPGSLSVIPVYTLLKDSRGNLWVGTWAGGLNLYMPQTKSFKRFLPDGKPGSICNANIFSILEDKAGNLWIGTIGGGLNRYNYETGKFTCYRNDKSDSSSLYGDYVNYIYQTSSGKLYIAVDNSLEIYDYQNDNFIHQVHQVKDPKGDFGNILSVFEDSRKHLWIATNAGLELFDENKKTFTSIDLGKQMRDNTIQGILEDGHENLWISTNKGISKFVRGATIPNQPVIYSYTEEDGISGNEFKRRSSYKDKDGIMYFGSSKGYTYFHPDSIKLNLIPPQVILSNFRVSNSAGVKNEKYRNLNMHINYLDTVELPYKNADFDITFAALNYLNPQNNHFRYKLEGYDNDWINADESQSARYTNLNHGEYTFMVIASNNDGIWCEAPRILKIIIHPPWWKTLAFKIAVILLFIAFLFGAYKMRFTILENQKRELEAIVNERTKELIEINEVLEQKQEEITIQFEELSRYKNHLEMIVEERTTDLRTAKEKAEESDRLKTAFLQNMSHEIRTPLNAIMGFSGLLDENFEDKETLASFASIINQKGRDLLEIINGILDISKIEAGSLGITLEKCKPDELFFELETFFKEYQHRMEKDHILFTTNNQSGIKTNVMLDVGKLKQVIINIVGNAFKFTASGSIELGCIRQGSNHLKFYVKDTGIGIPKDKQDLIFERFRQINEFHFHEGSGLGLSISKGLIELLGGDIWLTSEVQTGTTFYFTVPFFIGK